MHNKVRYPCGEAECERVFNRSDARLKHYRSYHKYAIRSLELPVLRKDCSSMNITK